MSIWLADAKNWLIWRIEGGKTRGQQDEMVGWWYHRLDGHGFGWTLGVGNGQGGLACCSPWGRQESDMTEWLNWLTDSDWCEVVSHCSFDLHFSNNEQCWASFYVFVSHLYVFFGEMSFSSFIFWLGRLFFWNWAACIFWKLIICQLFHLLLFSPILRVVVVVVFTLFVVFFAVQRFLSLIRSHLFIFVFISITLGDRSKKILLWFMLNVLCFSLRLL